jgi:hypothetical protein
MLLEHLGQLPWQFKRASGSSCVKVQTNDCLLMQASSSALNPVHFAGAEVREAVLRPQSAVLSEAIASSLVSCAANRCALC